MGESLVFLRVLGGLLGLVLILWVFTKYRMHRIQRREFFMTVLFGTALLVVAIVPDSINVVAGMLLMEDKQFGRLITLLILSNVLLWILIFGLREKTHNQSIQFDSVIRHLAQKQFEAEEGNAKIKEINIIIPALDEAENLKHILPKIPKEIDGYPLGVLVVDDGSEDDTVAVVREHGYPVASNPLRRGGGAALRLGYDIARNGPAKIIITMDGDGQHLPEEIERLVKPILKNEADIVIGSRVLGQREKDSTVRWIGIRVFNFIINVLTGTRITDCTNGFRAFRVEALEKIILHQDQFHTAELIIDAARKGLRIGEVPVTVLRRHYGESKKGRNMSYGFNFYKTVLKTWFRK